MRLVCTRDLFGKSVAVAATDGELVVRPIPKPQADEIIRAGHYSKSVVWSSNVHLGVYRGEDLLGALQFGPAMNPGSGASIVADCRSVEWLELNRMWFSDDKPEHCATRALSGAFRLLRHLRPELTWVQSFADERCGKLGAVYQAANFVYCGSHTTEFLRVDDEWFHPSMLGRAEYDKRGWWSGPKIARLRAAASRATKHSFRQFRYLYFLRPSAKKRLLLPILAYPKPEQAA